MLPLNIGVAEPFFPSSRTLNRYVAEGMAKVGFRIAWAVTELGKEGAKDPEIIQHVADSYGHRGVWITKDNTTTRGAKKLPEIEELAKHISLVWIEQQNLSATQQHYIVSRILHRVTPEIRESKRPIHYLVRFLGQRDREKITFDTLGKQKPWNNSR